MNLPVPKIVHCDYIATLSRCSFVLALAEAILYILAEFGYLRRCSKVVTAFDSNYSDIKSLRGRRFESCQRRIFAPIFELFPGPQSIPQESFGYSWYPSSLLSIIAVPAGLKEDMASPHHSTKRTRWE